MKDTLFEVIYLQFHLHIYKVFLEIASNDNRVISSNVIENKVIVHITSANPAYRFVYDFVHFP